MKAWRCKIVPDRLGAGGRTRVRIARAHPEAGQNTSIEPTVDIEPQKGAMSMLTKWKSKSRARDDCNRETARRGERTATTRHCARLGGPVVAACFLIFGVPVRGAVIVFLDFGSATETATKQDQRLFNDDGVNHITLLKGARRGYAPMDLGYANNNDRAAHITALVDQIRMDYRTAANMPYNINFVTERPTEGDFSTVSVVAGTYPNFRANVGPVTATFDLGAGRATINGGGLDGYYIRLTDGQVFRPNNMALEGLVLQEAPRLRPARTLGTAQRLDVRNRVATDGAWAFVGNHNAGMNNLSSDQRRTELGNTVSHELGHLLGLAHADGQNTTLMNGLYDGTDKGFGEREHRILAGVLAPKQPVQPRNRGAKSGDHDAHGSGKGPAPDPGAPEEEQAAFAFRSLRTATTAPLFDDIILPYSETYATDPEDGAYTDRLLSNGTVAEFFLTLDEPGVQAPLHAAWIEIEAMNIADTLGGPSDMKLFIDGFELPGAFDGVDQRGGISDPAGFAHTGVLKFFLDDYFSADSLNLMLADSELIMEILVNGESSGVSIDQVRLAVIDIPEPATAGLLLMVCLMVRRRRAGQ